jgi:hypothetical protein
MHFHKRFIEFVKNKFPGKAKKKSAQRVLMDSACIVFRFEAGPAIASPEKLAAEQEADWMAIAFDSETLGNAELLQDQDQDQNRIRDGNVADDEGQKVQPPQPLPQSVWWLHTGYWNMKLWQGAGMWLKEATEMQQDGHHYLFFTDDSEFSTIHRLFMHLDFSASWSCEALFE